MAFHGRKATERLGRKAAKVLDARRVDKIPYSPMRTHRQIIKDAGGPAAVAGAVGAEPNTAKQWGRNNSIPGRYWDALAVAKMASLEELAKAASSRRPGPAEAAA